MKRITGVIVFVSPIVVVIGALAVAIGFINTLVLIGGVLAIMAGSVLVAYVMSVGWNLMHSEESSGERRTEEIGGRA